MIYHVDLLLDDERRSASPVNTGMVMRLSAFVAVAVLILYVMMLVVESQKVANQVALAKGRWEDLQPKQKEFLNNRAALNELQASFRQIDACRRSRLDLGTELALLQRGVPADVQLTALRLNQFVGTQKEGVNAARSYEMHISGKIFGDDPKARVDELMQYLSAPANTGRVESVMVPKNGFRKETIRVSASGETRTDWFFELVCRYRPRSFE